MRYLNAATLVSGRPYVQNAVYFLARASSVSSLICFLSYPLEHRSMLIWNLFRATHGTSMSKHSQIGWGVFALLHDDHYVLHMVVKEVQPNPRLACRLSLTSLHRT